MESLRKCNCLSEASFAFLGAMTEKKALKNLTRDMLFAYFFKKVR